MNHSNCYDACGVVFVSELELPNVRTAQPDQAPSVLIRFGTVPQSISDAVASGVAFEAGPKRTLITVPNVGSFLVREGREVIIQRAPGAADSEIRVFIMNSVFAALLHQRGVLPLNASCIQVRDSCAAFTGSSSAGKSTLAAHLQRCGFPVIADDVCPARMHPELGAVVTPGFPRLKLWADTLDDLGINRDQLSRPRARLPKYEMVNQYCPVERFLPLSRIYVLCETRDKDPERIEPVTGASQRLTVLMNSTCQFRLMEGLGGSRSHLSMSAQLLKSVAVFRLWRPWGLSHMADVVDSLQDHLVAHTASIDARLAPAAA